MKKILTTFLAASMAISSFAQAYKAPEGGKQISDMLLGTFFEDISYAADGGLNAQLIQNGSFEYSLIEHPGWGAGTAWKYVYRNHTTGFVIPMSKDPINENNPNYMRIGVERMGHFSDHQDDQGYGAGISNSGFDGVVVKAGEKYDFSAFMRCPDGKDKTVKLVIADSLYTFAEDSLVVSGKEWKKYELPITAYDSCDSASFQILLVTEGVVDVDAVSLLPEDTFMGHGLRKDIAQAIADMHPKFVRFPGGCVVHGGECGLWNTYRWKTSIGPKEERVQMKNPWGYHQSREIGYYEYFQFCEDIEAKPLPILPSGVSCQGAGGCWGLDHEFGQIAVPMDQMDEWVDEVLDLIEWANGDVTTEWGAKRAAQGHPEPFNLEYVGIGNEEYITPEFEERFKYIYDRVTAAHPEIIIVGTAGVNSHPENEDDYVNGWKFADEIGLPIIDEHHYEKRSFYLTHRQYDSYPRDRKTKVYLGEYAAKDNTLMDALAEALYLCHVERNGDVVAMTSYAPLMCNMNHANWLPVLLLFDNTKLVRTCNYYVQQMFGASAGSYYYGDCVRIDGQNNLQEQSVVLNPEKRELYIKLCNAGGTKKNAEIDLSAFKEIGKKVKKAELTVLTGDSRAKNDMKSQKIEPETETISVSSKMTCEMAPFSFSMITVKL